MRRIWHYHAVALGLLVLRVVLGITFLMHGWQDVPEWRFSGTAQSFEGMSVRASTASAAFAITVELVGGIALILGVLTRIPAALLALDRAAGVVSDSGGFAPPGVMHRSGGTARSGGAHRPRGGRPGGAPCGTAPAAARDREWRGMDVAWQRPFG